jgi:acetyl-CoA carboxylase carboxyltransferase component
MPVLRSYLDPGSETYRANRAAMLERLARLEALLDQARAGGGARYVERHHARGKLLARERIELLIDPGAPFLELSPLAGATTEYKVGASLVTGVGVIEGTECVLLANDPTSLGGSINPYTLAKMLRAYEISLENRLPLLFLSSRAARTCRGRPRCSSPAARCSGASRAPRPRACR